MADKLTILSGDPQQTRQLGMWLGTLLQSGDLICLSGDLGAGKTALAVGIGAGWGAREVVNSPTFVFVHEHHRSRDNRCLYHVDCYRMASQEDALSVGIEDVLGSSDMAVIEWPERILALLPDERLWITLQALEVPEQRQLIFQANGTRYRTLLEDFRRHAESGIEGGTAGKISEDRR